MRLRFGPSRPLVAGAALLLALIALGTAGYSLVEGVTTANSW